MARRVQSLRGFTDLLPGSTEHWRGLENSAHELCRRYGFREIRPPHLESSSLFIRSVGETTDIVGKEMFTFTSGDESVSLRPELTASVCRAYIEHGLDRKSLNRLYYIGPAFRRERPQRGRLRQFHQIGVEVFGEPSAQTDVEVIALGINLVDAAGVEGAELRLNSIGDDECRPAYRAVLVEALRNIERELCEDCRMRIERNPIRVLDCKNESCQARLADVPRSVDHLCSDCSRHFDDVREGLDRLGVAHIVDSRLVRGLDYYLRTTFEIRAAGLGAQNAVLGGGRYDGLVESLGGPKTSGLGWAAGIERLLLSAGKEDQPAAANLDIYLVTLGPEGRTLALGLVQALRGRGLACGWDTAGHGLGGQMKRANRSEARFAVLVGDDEIAREVVTVKDLSTGKQSEAPLDSRKLAEWIRAKADSEPGSESRR